MNTTIRGHNPKTMAAIALIALALLLGVIFAAWPAATTSDRGDANPGIRATSAGGSGITDDPYIERHAEVVASYQ